MTLSRPRRASIGALMVFVAAGGCTAQPITKAPAPEEVPAQRTQALQATTPLSDEASPPAVVVRWDDESDVRGKVLYATIENTQSQVLSVSLEPILKVI